MKDFKIGIYKHFKGGMYLVLGVGKHTETEELMVVYVDLYENPNGQLWVRPLKMFTNYKEVDGKKVKRFTFVKAY